MTGKMAGSRIVYGRVTVMSARAQTRRMQYGYSNGAVIYLNGRQLALGHQLGHAHDHVLVGDFLPDGHPAGASKGGRAAIAGRLEFLGPAGFVPPVVPFSGPDVQVGVIHPDILPAEHVWQRDSSF